MAQPPKYKHACLNVYPLAAVVQGDKPAPDGELSKWLPDAFVNMYADPELEEVFAVRLALAYDERGLWIAADYTDRTPLQNYNDPTVDPFRGWDGDAMQIRLISDAHIDHPVPAEALISDAVVHLTLWHYTPRQEPVLDVRYGFDFHDTHTLTGSESGLAFRTRPGGYLMEALIPWSRLKTCAPSPGQRWIFTLQPLWGDGGSQVHNFYDCVSVAGFAFLGVEPWGHVRFVAPDEVADTFTAQAAEEQRIFAGDAGPATGIPVRFAPPADGYVSLAICAEDGQIVRTLLAKAQRPAGMQEERWDGLDDDGQPVPPGAYTLRGLTHPGIAASFVVSVHHSGNPPWVTADGRGGWGGDHGLPIGAVSDPEGFTYLLWTFNEGGNFLIKVDQQGQKLWGARISWGDFDGGATALTYDNGLLYIAKDGAKLAKAETVHGGLFCYAASDGRRLNFPQGEGLLTVTSWSKSLLADVTDHGTPGERMHAGRFTAADLCANLTGVAAGPRYVYVSLYLENTILALDKATFTVAASFPVPRPAGLAYDAAARCLYAVSGESVVRLDPENGTLTPFVSGGLDYPYGLAVDGQGRLWVSVRGGQMRVLAFDHTGQCVHAIGTPGGRPWVGTYDAHGMLLPAGISVDTHGQLWVMEYDETPKRISVWDTASGDLRHEFFGSSAYAPMMAPDPEQPEEVYIHNTRFRVNYAHGTATPEATVFRTNYEGPSIPGPETGYGFMGATFEIARYAGKTFAFNGQGGVFAVEGDRFHPLLHIGLTLENIPGVPNDPGGVDTREVHTAGMVWVDDNGDGLLDANEIRPVTSVTLYNNIAQFGATFFPGAAFIKGKRLFRPNGLDARGIPQYPAPEDAPPVVTHPQSAMAAFENWLDVWPSLSSDYREFYAIASRHGDCYTGDGSDSVMRFTRDGRIKWRYRRVAVGFGLKAPLARPGDLFGALRILGQVSLPAEHGGEILGIGCYRGYFAFLSDDGLFIDQVGYDNGRGPAPDFDAFFIENFSGYFFRHPRTGKVYLFGGDVDGRILELQGWEAIRRFTAAPLIVSEEDHRLACANAAARGTMTAAATPLHVTAATPSPDATLAGWEAVTFTPIALDETTCAEVGLAYDARHLYACFRVPDSSPWQNAATDWRYLFKGGDAVDIQLGPHHPETPRTAQHGDVRVLLAPTADGKCQAVAMWPLLPDGMPPAPLRYQSPVGEEPFARVAVLPEVACHAYCTEDSYLLLAALPWAALGMTPPSPGATCQGDIGILLSDAGGTQTIRRRYLFNQDTAIINDIPSEVRMPCANWGVVAFG